MTSPGYIRVELSAERSRLPAAERHADDEGESDGERKSHFSQTSNGWSVYWENNPTPALSQIDFTGEGRSADEAAAQGPADDVEMEDVSPTQVDPIAGESSAGGSRLTATATSATLAPSPTSACFKRPNMDSSPPQSATKIRKLGHPQSTKGVTEYYAIAHSRLHQAYLDSNDLSWGVLWEISWLIVHRRLFWDDIAIEDLRKLCGSNIDMAPQVAKILKARPPVQASSTAAQAEDVATEELENVESFEAETEVRTYLDPEIATTSPFAELDAEEDYLRLDSYRRLGKPEYEDYFGGRVEQVMRLIPNKKGFENAQISNAKDLLEGMNAKDRFRLIMMKQTRGKSSRLKRFYGSRRCATVQISKLTMKHVKSGRWLTEFFLQPFVICGRVFRAGFAKEATVNLFQTNELCDRLSLGMPDQQACLSLMELLRWHNDWNANTRQAMTKWASRMALGLSTSVPSVEFDFKNVRTIPDIISDEHKHNPSPPAEAIMTDGCGQGSRSMFRIVGQQFKCCDPAAIQVRLGGVKGMILREPGLGGYDEAPTITARRSQVKIEWPYDSSEPLHPAKLILDILRLPKTTYPAKLSSETLINLSHNGVPNKVFRDYFRQGLMGVVKALTTWRENDSESLALLAYNVFKEGNILGERKRRQAASTARARGYGELESAEIDDLGDGEGSASLESAAWWPDPISGLPSSLHETVYQFLIAGFCPGSNKTLYSKLKAVLRTAIDNYVKRYKIPVPCSLSAFIVPDPFDLPRLQENQIFLRFATPIVDPVTGQPVDVLTGDVLVGRHPIKLSTDIRKVKAVDIPELREYRDVVIFPTVGSQSLASVLSGGDYDGDRIILIWDEAIVREFRNADLAMSVCLPGVDDDLEQNNTTVKEFLERTRSVDPDCQQEEFQKVLLGSLENSTIVGQYSNWHELAVYSLGLDHAKTRRLAHLFCMQLDGAKSGKRIKAEAFDKDEKQWNKKKEPMWKRSTAEDLGFKSDLDSKSDLDRDAELPSFIMTELHALGKAESERHFGNFESRGPSHSSGDLCLLAPYRDALERARESELIDQNPYPMTELKAIEDQVDNVCTRHKLEVQLKNKAFTAKPIQVRQDVFRSLSAEFTTLNRNYRNFSEAEIMRIKASYAYTKDPSSQFAWDVGFRSLCAIKVEALGPWSPVKQDIFDKMVIHSSSILRDEDGPTLQCQ